MNEQRISHITRPLNTMPVFVRQALNERGLMETYRSRPPYQQNDYLGWIIRAKLAPTQERRLAQMLHELDRGDRYMKMVYPAKRKVNGAKHK